MRTRLLATMLSLVLLPVVGLGVPLAVTLAERGSVPHAWAVVAASAALVLGLAAVAALTLARAVRVPLGRLAEAVAALPDERRSGPVGLASGPPEVVRLGELVDEAAERVRDRLDRLRSFVANVGHQLGTPLATLELSAHNLADAVSEHGVADHAALVGEIQWMTELCAGLTEYARAERPAEMVSVDVAAIADSRVTSWQRRAEAAGVRLVRRGADDVPARAVASAVGQCLDVLIDNAVKYAGHGAVVVVAVSRDVGGWTRVDVVDNGPRLPEADLARLAEPFWRREPNGSTSGTGLGLAIVAALVSAGDGELTLHAAHPSGLHARIRMKSATG